MERIIILIAGLIVIVALVVVIELKFPNSPILKAFGRAFGALAVLATIVQVLPIDLAGWLRPPDEPKVVIPAFVPKDGVVATAAPMPDYPTALALPTGTSRPANNFTPRPGGSVLYQKDLQRQSDSPEWGAADDELGHSSYDGHGYVVGAPQGQRSHFVLNRLSDYTNFALEVDVTPLSAENTPAIMIVVGWRENGPVYQFIIQPDGQCGRAVFDGGSWRQVDKDPFCPQPTIDATQRVRLEVNERQLRAFINAQPIKEYSLDGYNGGAIGLGVLNYAPRGSDTEATARFNNLVLWALP